MKRNKTNGCFVVAVTVVFLLCSSLERLYAQDPLPPIARVSESFKHTADNVIEDSTRSMVPFFRN